MPINQLTSPRRADNRPPASKFDRLIDLHFGLVCKMDLTLTGGVA